MAFTRVLRSLSWHRGSRRREVFTFGPVARLAPAQALLQDGAAVVVPSNGDNVPGVAWRWRRWRRWSRPWAPWMFLAPNSGMMMIHHLPGPAK